MPDSGVRVDRCERGIQFQEPQCAHQHIPLSICISRQAKNCAAREFCNQGAWRVDQPDAPCIPGDNDRGDAGHLESSRNQSHGLVADRSHRSEKRSGCTLVFCLCDQFGSEVFCDGCRVGLVTHEADDSVRQRADDALAGQ